MKILEDVMAAKAAQITHVLTDVDGVHTSREGGVSICDLLSSDIPNGFAEVNGDRVRALIPCDLYGVPEKNVVRYIAGEEGNRVFEIYQFYTPDGQAVIDLLARGLAVTLISGRNSPCVRVRAHALGARSALGVKKKYQWLNEQGWFDPAKTLFVSDNDTDVDLLCAVREAGGIAIATADAQSEARTAAECVTRAKGGKGVVAEIGKALISAMDLR